MSALRPATRVHRHPERVRLPLEEFSAKVRTGPPKDPEEDLDLPIWAGVVPLGLAIAAPLDSPDLMPGPVPPEYAVRYRR